MRPGGRTRVSIISHPSPNRGPDVVHTMPHLESMEPSRYALLFRQAPSRLLVLEPCAPFHFHVRDVTDSYLDVTFLRVPSSPSFRPSSFEFKPKAGVLQREVHPLVHQLAKSFVVR